MKNNKPVALIPAYKPDPAVIDVVCDLVRSEIFQAVVVVNDGSGQASDVIFRELQGIARLVGLPRLRFQKKPRYAHRSHSDH